MTFRRPHLLGLSMLLAAIAAAAIWLAPGSHASTPRPARTSARAQRIVLSLALSHQSALDRYVHSVDTVGSANYHHFLTPAQFRARFGASRRQVNTVLTRLRGLGYGASSVSSNRLYVTVATGGRQANIATAERQSHVATDLQQSLGSLVSGVITPDEMPTLSPDLSSPTPKAASAGTRSAARTAALRAGVDGGASPCRAAQASGGYTAPALAKGYDFNGLYAQGFHGEGMSAAVLEFGGYHDANVNGFAKCYGVHVPVSRVVVDGGSGSVANSSETEVALDIEVLLEMAPQLAHVYVIEAPNDGAGEIAAYNAFVTQDKAPVLSESWGGCEEGSSQSYERLLATIEEEGVAQGQQMFVSAGDSGSKGCQAQTLPTGGSLSADMEDALPWITGVGGTDLSVASTQPNATVHREAVWNDGLGAGGGGQSVAWAMPGYQSSYLAATGEKPAGMQNICGAPIGQDCRLEPDIAFDADGEEGGADASYWDVPKGPRPAQFSKDGDVGSPGYAVYCASSDCSAGGSGWGRVGGTSAASPLAAAAAVLWDEEAQRAGVSLGFLNPGLYSLASNPTTEARDFTDIRGGTNNDQFTQYSCIAKCPKLYRATAGYDMATGLGSLNVTNAGADLVSAAGGITATPSIEHLYGYTGGGPTTTAPVSITSPTVNNSTSTYTATSDASWLVVSSGASDPSTLDWHVDPTGLAAGVYQGTITITASDGASTNLDVTYTVTPPAKIKLLTRSLHFSEQQVKPLGAKHLKICGTPLWGDELEDRGTLPAVFGLSAPGNETASARRTLSFTNSGPNGSQLHYSIDQLASGWVGNDLDPHSNPAGVRLTPGKTLVPSEGILGHGKTAGIKLASLANENTVSGVPSLQQGTYHGHIVVRDLADPSDTATVPITVTLGSGKGTPRIGVNHRALTLTSAPGKVRVFQIRLSDPGGACGYGYSMSTTASWLDAGQQRHTGSVSAHSSKAVRIILSVPADQAPGVYHAEIDIASANAAESLVRVPVTLTVS